MTAHESAEAAPPEPVAADVRRIDHAAQQVSERLANRLRAWINVESDGPRRARLSYELGELIERVDGDDLGAARQYLAAFNSSPEFRPPLFALLRLYARRRSVPNQLKLVNALVAAAPDDAERAAALAARAEIQLDRSGDSTAALHSVEEALAVDPACRSALVLLERLGALLDDASLRTRARRALADASNDPVRAALLRLDAARDLLAIGTDDGRDEAQALLTAIAVSPDGDAVAGAEARLVGQQHGLRLETRTSSLLARESRDPTVAIDAWCATALAALAAGDRDGAVSAVDEAIARGAENVRVQETALVVAEHFDDRVRAGAAARWLLLQGVGDEARTTSWWRHVARAGGGDAATAAVELLARAPGTESIALALVLARDGDEMLAHALDSALDDAAERTRAEHGRWLARLAREHDTAGVARDVAAWLERNPGDVTAARWWLALTADDASTDAADEQRAMDAVLSVARGDDEGHGVLARRFARVGASEADLAPASGTPEWLLRAAIVRAAGLGDDGAGVVDAALRWLGTHGAEASAEDVIAMLDLVARTDPAAASRAALDAHRARPDDTAIALCALVRAASTGATHEALGVASALALRLPEERRAHAWLVGAAMLGSHGHEAASRSALASAVSTDPLAAAVGDAVRSSDAWSRAGSLRTLRAHAITSRGIADDAGRGALTALALADVFVRHDPTAASVRLDRAAVGAPGLDVTGMLLRALVAGISSDESPAAWRAFIDALPADDEGSRAAVQRELARYAAAAGTLSALDATDDAVVALARVEVRGASPMAPAVRTLVADEPDDVARAVLDGIAFAEGETEVAHTAPDEAVRDALATGGAVRSARAALVDAIVRGEGAAIASAVATLAELAPDDAILADVQLALARASGDPAALCDALEAAARRAVAGQQSAALWEEAGALAHEPLGDDARAERDWHEALAVDALRPVAFARLRALFDARRDPAALDALVDARLAALPANGASRLALWWEQARARRALGRREAALESASAVIAASPGHVAALAMVAEIHGSSGRLLEASHALVQLADSPQTPAAQRRLARLGAIEILEQRVDSPDEALRQLLALVRAGDADGATFDRAVTLATRSGHWEPVVEIAEALAERAPTAADSAVANLRIAGLFLDRLREPDRATPYARRAHAAAPRSPAVVRVLLPLVDEDERAEVLRTSLGALRAALRAEPSDTVATAIAEIAQLGADGVLADFARRLADALVGLPDGPSAVDSLGAWIEPAVIRRYRAPDDDAAANEAAREALRALGALPEVVSTEPFEQARGAVLAALGLPALAPDVATVLDEPAARVVRAAFSTARRGAMAATRAVDEALRDLEQAGGDAEARAELCVFAVSDAIVALAREIGT